MSIVYGLKWTIFGPKYCISQFQVHWLDRKWNRIWHFWKLTSALNCLKGWWAAAKFCENCAKCGMTAGCPFWNDFTIDGIDWTGSGPEVGPDSVSDELPEPDETPDDELLLPVGDRICFRDFLLSRSLLPRRFEIEKLRFGFFGSHDGVSITSTSTWKNFLEISSNFPSKISQFEDKNLGKNTGQIWVIKSQFDVKKCLILVKNG